MNPFKHKAGTLIEKEENGGVTVKPYKPGEETKDDSVQPQMSLVTYSKMYQETKQDEDKAKKELEKQLLMQASYQTTSNNTNTNIPVSDSDVPLSFAPQSFA